MAKKNLRAQLAHPEHYTFKFFVRNEAGFKPMVVIDGLQKLRSQDSENCMVMIGILGVLG